MRWLRKWALWLLCPVFIAACYVGVSALNEISCANTWAPRPTHYSPWDGCHVKLDGEWWPVDAVRAP